MVTEGQRDEASSIRDHSAHTESSVDQTPSPRPRTDSAPCPPAAEISATSTQGLRPDRPTDSGDRRLVLSRYRLPTRGSHDAPQPGPPTDSGGRTMVLSPDHLELEAALPAPQPGPPTNSGGRTMVLGPDHRPTRGVAPRSSTRTTRQLRESRRLPARAPSPLRTRDDRPSALFPTGPRESPGLLRCRAPRGQTKLCACERSPSDVAPTERTDSHGSPPLPRTSPRSPPLRSTVNHPTEPRGAQFFS